MIKHKYISHKTGKQVSVEIFIDSAGSINYDFQGDIATPAEYSRLTEEAQVVAHNLLSQKTLLG